MFKLIGGGLGDRHQQNGVNYTLDLAVGLTQVLSDGTNTYLYGNGRIAQQALTTEYFLTDALGSVRQLADPAGVVTLTQSYAPYGETVSSLGGGYSKFQFTGEAANPNRLAPHAPDTRQLCCWKYGRLVRSHDWTDLFRDVSG